MNSAGKSLHQFYSIGRADGKSGAAVSAWLEDNSN
jgi:hypothetical protein